MLAKLSELLFVEAVRRYAETLPEGQTGWLAGLRDYYVARALTLLHRDMTRSWTLVVLMRCSAMVPLHPVGVRLQDGPCAHSRFTSTLAS